MTLNELIENATLAKTDEYDFTDGWIESAVAILKQQAQEIEQLNEEKMMKAIVKAVAEKRRYDKKDVPETKDMTGKPCDCKKGTYQETSFWDDIDGVLHCTSCHKQVNRYQSVETKKKEAV
jgi:hypothetical protein